MNEATRVLRRPAPAWMGGSLPKRLKRWGDQFFKRMRRAVFAREDLRAAKDPRVKEFYRLLHKRGMTLTKIGTAIGCKSHGQISSAIRGVPGRGKEVRTRIMECGILTAGELQVLGWSREGSEGGEGRTANS